MFDCQQFWNWVPLAILVCFWNFLRACISSSFWRLLFLFYYGRLDALWNYAFRHRHLHLHLHLKKYDTQWMNRSHTMTWIWLTVSIYVGMNFARLTPRVLCWRFPSKECLYVSIKLSDFLVASFVPASLLNVRNVKIIVKIWYFGLRMRL